MATYGELHAHSGFSFLDGASDPEELVVEAVRLKLSGLALTDHHGFYGVVRFAEAARSVGLATIFGSEITLNGQDDRVGERDPSGQHLVVLARSPEGYRHLATMLGEAHLARGDKGAPRFTLEDVATHAKDWLVLSGCRKGPLTRALLNEGPRASARALERLIEAFGRANLAVELWDHGTPTTWRATTCSPSWRSATTSVPWRRATCTTPRPTPSPGPTSWPPSARVRAWRR